MNSDMLHRDAEHQLSRDAELQLSRDAELQMRLADGGGGGGGAGGAGENGAKENGGAGKQFLHQAEERSFCTKRKMLVGLDVLCLCIAAGQKKQKRQCANGTLALIIKARGQLCREAAPSPRQPMGEPVGTVPRGYRPTWVPSHVGTVPRGYRPTWVPSHVGTVPRGTVHVGTVPRGYRPRGTVPRGYRPTWVPSHVGTVPRGTVPAGVDGASWFSQKMAGCERSAWA
ncbi:hypothetical protein NHX12_031247 [Muraenolepis orangiensis]|uniref:Uncharacterized protein n=1 Tax=Muraenolepis orangiensis TaxID=630683 RepID=A0A9Q0E4X1_9TELE|nr:hypothetical protein NHX12_031247 [Muraenolepis orangiensis]